MFKHRFVRWGVLGLAVVGLPGGLSVRLFPLQIRDAYHRWQVARSGAGPIQSEGPGVRLAGLSLGSGTCVVLVHGIGDAGTTWRHVMGDRRWMAQIAEPMRLVAWELPGHGRSERPAATAEGTSELEPRRMARRLLEATRAAGCTGKSVWVGNSLGGWVAAWAALLAPEQVRGLVLLAPAGLAIQADVGGTVAKGVRALAEPSIPSVKEFWDRANARPDSGYPDWVWEAVIQRLQRSVVRRALVAQTSADRLDAHLGKVRVPTVVVWGKQDRILYPKDGEAFRRLAPEIMSSSREVDDCGHLPQKECPQAVTDAIRDVLRFGTF